MENRVPRLQQATTAGTIATNENQRQLDWLTGPGALYNWGNFLALSSGILLSLRAASGQSSWFEALRDHLIGSPEAVWLTVSMVLFIVSGEIYRSAGRPNAQARLLYWGDFVSGVAAIFLTIALSRLGDSAVALLGGLMLTLGKLGSAALPLVFAGGSASLDRVLRLTVVASRAPSILSLALAVSPIGHVSLDDALLPLIMIVCFLLWLWADLLLLRG